MKKINYNLYNPAADGPTDMDILMEKAIIQEDNDTILNIFKNSDDIKKHILSFEIYPNYDLLDIIFYDILSFNKYAKKDNPYYLTNLGCRNSLSIEADEYVQTLEYAIDNHYYNITRYLLQRIMKLDEDNIYRLLKTYGEPKSTNDKNDLKFKNFVNEKKDLLRIITKINIPYQGLLKKLQEHSNSKNISLYSKSLQQENNNIKQDRLKSKDVPRIFNEICYSFKNTVKTDTKPAINRLNVINKICHKLKYYLLIINLLEKKLSIIKKDEEDKITPYSYRLIPEAIMNICSYLFCLPINQDALYYYLGQNFRSDEKTLPLTLEEAYNLKLFSKQISKSRDESRRDKHYKERFQTSSRDL